MTAMKKAARRRPCTGLPNARALKRDADLGLDQPVVRTGLAGGACAATLGELRAADPVTRARVGALLTEIVALATPKRRR